MNRMKFVTRRLRNFLFTTMIGGLVVVLPLAILFLLFRFLYRLIDSFLEPLAKFIGLSLQLNPTLIEILTFFATIILLFLIGLLIQTSIGNNLFSWFEREWLSRIPFYSTIRETVQQFTGNKKAPFKQVVLVDAFGNGTRMTGFVVDKHDDGGYTVFVPTAPNPTNGFVFHLDPEQVKFVDVSTEDAMRSIVGMGVGSNKIYKDL